MGMFRNLLCKGLIDAPSNYIKVDYIQNVGRGYIDTGIIASVDVAARGKIFRSFTSGDRYILGGRISDARGLYLAWSANSGWYYGLGYFSASSEKTTQESTFDVNFYKKTAFVNNNPYTIDARGTSVPYPNCKIQIFFTKLETSTSTLSYACASGCKCYELELYNSKNGALIRKFVPVMNNDTNEYGMWEMVKGKFYGNAWSQGSITGGFD